MDPELTRLPGRKQSLLTKLLPFFEDLESLIEVGSVSTGKSLHKKSNQGFQTMIKHYYQSTRTFQVDVDYGTSGQVFFITITKEEHKESVQEFIENYKI